MLSIWYTYGIDLQLHVYMHIYKDKDYIKTNIVKNIIL